jgi:hypothetical protein
MNYFHSRLDVTKTTQWCREKHNHKKDIRFTPLLQFLNQNNKLSYLCTTYLSVALWTSQSIPLNLIYPVRQGKHLSELPHCIMWIGELYKVNCWALKEGHIECARPCSGAWLIQWQHAQGHLSSPKVSPSHLKLYRKWTTSDSIPAYAHECRWINICSYKRIWSCHFIFQSAYLSSFYQIT